MDKSNILFLISPLYLTILSLASTVHSSVGRTSVSNKIRKEREIVEKTGRMDIQENGRKKRHRKKEMQNLERKVKLQRNRKG